VHVESLRHRAQEPLNAALATIERSFVFTVGGLIFGRRRAARR